MMKRMGSALAGAVLAFAAHAAPGSDDLLEPEKAFRLSARAVAGRGIELVYRIEPGYYLYRDRFKVTAPGLPLGPLEPPQGIEKNDPFVGTTRIFRDTVTLHVPFSGSVRLGSHVVNVTAQGCAEERVCYAPFTQTVTVSVSGAN